MIESDAQLDQTRQALARLETALGSLRDRIKGVNPALFEAMAQDYVEGIRGLREEIEEYVGVTGVQDARMPLWMTLEGGQQEGREISSRILSEWLGRLRKALYHVTSFLETGTVRSTGRPDSVLLAATDPHVIAVRAGSVRIGLNLPSRDQDDLFSAGDATTTPQPAGRALERLLLMTAWAASPRVEPPLEEFPDRDEAALLARQAASLVPSPRSTVRTITFEGPLVPSERPIRVNAEVRGKLTGLVHLLRRVSEQTAYGHIREIDLDALRIILRERGPDLPDLRCFLPASLMPKAEDLLDQSVAVTGLVTSDDPFTMHVSGLERRP